MNQSLCYPLIVRVIVWNGRDYYQGSSPEFGWVVTELVEPGNVSQEFMFYLGLRRKIKASLLVCVSEGKDPPVVSPSVFQFQSVGLDEDMKGSNNSGETVSTRTAAQMLHVHENTVRSHFDSGLLKGLVSKGGHRMVFLSSIRAQQEAMQKDSKNRVVEERSRKKNGRRKAQRQMREKAKKLERFHKYFVSNADTSKD